MYNKVFKNNQITYGRPYQVKLPDSLIKFTDAEDSNDQEDPSELSPEELLKRAEKNPGTLSLRQRLKPKT